VVRNRRLSNLARHRNTIKCKDEQYHCVQCSIYFSLSSELQQHLKLHTNKRPKVPRSRAVQCPQCGEHFKTFLSFREHLNVIHGEPKPYECTKCEKRFKWHQNLCTHLEIHSGEKPHICARCNKGFGRSSTLDRHYVSVHGDIKPFKCNQCDKRMLIHQV